MRISDWSSDVCSSDLLVERFRYRLGVGCRAAADHDPGTARGEHLGNIQAHALRSADNDGDLARQVELVVAHANLPVNLHFPDWTVGAATIDRNGPACANGDDFPLNEIGRAHVGTPVTNAQ